MQTILGASGQIGHELAIYLKRDFANDIRLVSRNPKQVNGSNQLHRADLPGLHPGRVSRPGQGLGGQVRAGPSAHRLPQTVQPARPRG
ncbi:hypothetical protein [Nitrobacter sp.]|uniref:hypothetical protein n=1 Tax=Nitrobacter sp. TaxID=29420 RepID=UPI003F650C4F